jgi:CubicO group peptidase (beta-lactamase class C family)
MNKKQTIYSTVIVFFTLSFSAFAAEIDYTKLNAYIEKTVLDANVTGMAVGIIKDNDVVFAKGYGLRSANTKSPVNLQTQFGIGSCSKAFTSAAIGILVDEGKLRWKDKVIDFLPWFKLQDDYITRELTIEDLLCHRSGLATFDGDLLWFGTHYTSEEVVRRIKEAPIKKDFRSQFSYQNIMFITAGLVIQSVSGKAWQEFVEERILNPLNMNHSSSNFADFKAGSNVALPHYEGKSLPLINYDNVGPAGGINASVEDMLKWMNVWINDGLMGDTPFLSQRTFHSLTSAHMIIGSLARTEPMGTHFNTYGLGWRLEDYAGRKIIQHGGGLPGYLSQVVAVPEEKLAIVILENDLVPIHWAVANKIRDLFLTDKDIDYVQQVMKARDRHNPILEKQRQTRLDKQIPGTSHSKPLTAYTGLYTDKMYGDAEISHEDGKLILSLLPAKEYFTTVMEHFHYDTFKIDFNLDYLEFGLLTFNLNSDGHIQGFVIDLPSNDLHFSNLKFTKQKTK